MANLDTGTSQRYGKAAGTMSYIDELRGLSKQELESAIESKISETADDLVNDESVAGEIASTNAIGWGLDVFEVLEIELIDQMAHARIAYQLNGHQDDDKPWHGTEINGEALALIGSEGDVYYTDVTASRDLDYDLISRLGDDEEDIYRKLDEPRLFTDLTAEIKAHLACHPEKLYELTPRKFEELIADILKDFGFTTELTAATRDGGRDIYAYVKNAVTSFLMFVECKKWSPLNKIGIPIVQRVYGAAKAGGAHKAMIVTTSFFTAPAQKEQKRISGEMELKDFNALKDWLSRYYELPILPETI